LRFRHGAFIHFVAFTPDGTRCVSADWSEIRVWETATGKAVRTLGGPFGTHLRALHLFADGKTLAALVHGHAGQDALVHVYDLDSGQELRRFTVDNFSALWGAPSGLLLATAHGKAIRLWDTGTGRELRQLAGHEGAVHAVAFTADGMTLLSGGEDRVIRVWDVATGKERRRLAHGRPGVLHLALSPDGTTLASLGGVKTEGKTANGGFFTTWHYDGQVQLWDVATGGLVRAFGTSARPEADGDSPWKRKTITALAFTPDGAALLTTDSDQRLRVWHVASGRELRRWPAPNARCLAIARDGRTLAVGGPSAVRLWDIERGARPAPGDGHRAGIGGVAFAPDGRSVATAGGDDTIRLWDPASGRPLRTVTADARGVSSALFTADGRTLVSSGWDGTIRCWDVQRGAEVRRLAGLGDQLSKLALSPDGRSVAAAVGTNEVRIWEVATGRELLRVQGLPGQAASVAFAPDGRELFGWCWDKTVRIWDAATGALRRSFPAGHADPTYAVAFAPDGSLVALGGQKPVLLLYDLRTGQKVRELTGLPGAVSEVAFAPDGRTLVSGGWYDGDVRVWELATGRVRHQFRGHRGRIFSLAFSRDCRVLASGAEDTTALLWDTAGSPGDRGGLTREALEARWEALQGEDAASAGRAMADLIRAPQAAVPFLAGHVQPMPENGPEQRRRIAGLIADLDSATLAPRQRATRELGKLGEAAEPALREVLAAGDSLELRRRVAALLRQRDELGRVHDRLRLTRAVEVLERVGTPEARRLVEALAQGASWAWVTHEARGSAQRMGKRAAVAP
jgi:WD40 repeat protein